MSGLFGPSVIATSSGTWATSTTSPPTKWGPFKYRVNGIDLTIEEMQFILEREFTPEQLEKKLIAYRLTEKSLESHG